MEKNIFFRCIKCLMVSTRPRITFDKNGVCSACINFEERKKINWRLREKQLKTICNKIRKNNGDHDVVVPVGGGKDSSYVAWTLKNKYNMNPIGVFCEPPMFTELGEKNLNSFMSSGFDVIRISQTEAFRKMEKITFLESGLPQNNWVGLIAVAPIRIAKKLNIKLIMWGEEGESMYGGNNSQKNKMNFETSMFKIKQNNNTIEKYLKKGMKKKDFYWSNLSSWELNQFSHIIKSHWSYFEKWDEDKHLELAKKYCGLEYDKKRQDNAINNHSHTDQRLYALHMYIAYLKFGFGRATTDVCIAIRHGKMSRKKAIKIVKKYDHIFPHSFTDDYCKFFKMDKKKFFKSLEKFINEDIFIKKNNKLILKDSIH